MNAATAKDAGHIDAIDGLRGATALYVLFHHCFVDSPDKSNWLVALSSAGWEAVPPFFMVSGFIIFSQIRRLRARDPQWRSNFVIGRAFRILPLWWLLLLLDGIIRRTDIRALILNATFAFGFVSFDSKYIVVHPAWSLFVEEWFYLLFPWLVGFLSGGLNIALCLAGTIVLEYAWRLGAPALGVPTGNFFIYRAPPANFQFIVVGIAIAFALESSRLGEWVKRELKGLKAICLDVMTVAAFVLPAKESYVPLELSCALLLIAALSPGSLLSKFFRLSWIRWAGRNCYSIYISEPFVWGWLTPLREHANTALGLSEAATYLFWFPFHAATILIFAALTRRAWELPWIRFGRAWVGRRSAPAVAS